MPEGRIRALVVEDSLTVRRRVVEVLSSDPGIVVAGEAADGRRAIELCQALRPDVVTMDMMLPLMTGLAATEFIMAHCPTPILVVSSSFNRRELFKTYDALAAGALDVLEKPGPDDADGVWEARLVAAVKLVSRIRVITHPRARLATLGPAGLGSGANASAAVDAGPRLPAATAPSSRSPLQLLAIGASTGGPAAVLSVLRALPPEFRVPVALVLHIAEPFGVAFAEWLGSQCGRPAAYAREGEPVHAAAGRVVMAPPSRHLRVDGGRFRLDDGPERHSCRPSVDVLFDSVAQDLGPVAAACLLTGMGRDGAAGMLAMRRAGAHTIAQDEASSVVWGMPREAVQLGAALRVLPLGAIGPAVAALGGVAAPAPGAPR
jgi:two-component system chemotaxis response regulator CheB